MTPCGNCTNTNIAIGGLGTGTTQSGPGNVALGFQAGETQDFTCIAVGYRAGLVQVGPDCISIGSNAGLAQASESVAIGAKAGQDQSAGSVAIGSAAGNAAQSSACVAVGAFAGNSAQGTRAVAIGRDAGNADQGERSVAVGEGAGFSTQGNHSVAIGFEAGNVSLPDLAIALGYRAALGAATLGFYVGTDLVGNPIIRNTTPLAAEVPLYYDKVSNEIVTIDPPPSNPSYSIGDAAYGGVVAYLDTAAGTSGFVVALNDDFASPLRWYGGTMGLTRAESSGLGSGQSNTTTIIAATVAIGDDSLPYAAFVASNYNPGWAPLTGGPLVKLGGWFLPSISEFRKLLNNSVAISAGLTAAGGTPLTSGNYWTSSERTDSAAWAIDVVSEVASPFPKSDINKVRAMVRFP
jgi:hypothetical protein